MPVQNIIPGQTLNLRFTPAQLMLLAGVMGGMPPGNVYFVDSGATNAADNAGAGTRTQPFATINWPMSNANSPVTANQGDVLLVHPRHAETITAAGGINLNRAGAFVLNMALGLGQDKPLISFTTATTADLDVNAANITLAGFDISLVGIDALAAPIDVNAAGFGFYNNRVVGADATNQAVLAMLTDANASRMKVKGNLFTGTSDAGMTAAIRLVGGSEIEIEENIFIGAYTAGVGAIENITTAVTWLQILRNSIQNLTAANTKAIVAIAGTTGQIAENKMQILSGLAPITAAGMSWVGGNYYANVVATAGTLI